MKLKRQEIDNLEIDGVDTSDFPDFCDAYIVSGDIKDSGTGEWREMTEGEIDQLTKARPDLINEMAFEHYIASL